MPYIPNEVLQPLVNSFVQVMYLDWLMYEADLKKIEYRLSMKHECEYSSEYSTRHNIRLRRSRRVVDTPFNGLVPTTCTGWRVCKQDMIRLGQNCLNHLSA